MTDVAEYLALITSEHSQKARFVETVRASVAPSAQLQAILNSLPAAFDIDAAVGVQLDATGLWIGRTRRIDTPLTGVYFTWDDTVADGWNGGVWKAPFDPDSGLVDLPDDSYRTLLRAKIAANNWDGSIPQAYAIWQSAFGGSSYLLIQDNQDMSMVVGIAGQPLSTVTQALLINGYIPLKPAGVRVAYYAVAPAAGPLLVWDATPDAAVAGWDTGYWASILIPA